MVEDRIREAVIAYLKADPGVAAVLGNRMFPVVIPENVDVFPAAAVSRVFAEDWYDKTGSLGVTESRIECSTVAERKIDAVRAANAIRTALGGFHGDVGGLTVKICRFVEQVDMFEHNANLYQVTSDYRIVHKED